MLQKHRGMPGRGIFHSAGWLFADLLLAMMMIFLVASGVGTYIPPVAKTPTPTPPIVGLDRIPLAFSVYGDPYGLEQGDPGTISDLRNQVTAVLKQKKELKGKVGIVLTFGGSDQGQDFADAFNTKVLKTISNFGKAVFRKFLDLGNPPEQFELEIYFFI